MKSILSSLILSVAIFTLSSCNITDPGRGSNVPLSDSIPYTKLGSGKLVFQRIGQFGSNFRAIYVVDIDHQRSWNAGGGLSAGPAVSPDGQKIAYIPITFGTETGYDVHVYVMNIDGTGSQRVSDMAGLENCPSWTPDGKQIVFYVLKEDTPETIPLYRQSPVPNPTDRTLVLDLEKVHPHYLLCGPVSVSASGKMAVSSDGDGIYIFDSDGINFNKINGILFSPSWSPDGKYLAALEFPSNWSGINPPVSVVLFDSTGAEPATLVTVPTYGVSSYASLCWSPDGSKIAFARPDSRSYVQHIYVINRDGTGLTQVTSADSVSDESLSWSR